MSVDHLFIDLDISEDPGLPKKISGVAVVRTSDRGKVLGATGNAGNLAAITDSIDTMVTQFSAPYVVVAVNADKKRQALRVACQSEGEADPFKGRAWLDFGQVAWPLALADLVPNRSLETVGAHFHVTREHAGTLTGDCAYLTAVYWAMARSYRAAMGVEGLARQAATKYVSGSALSNFRRLIGI